ncbi:MAG TPA: amidohydrolase family protein [Acidimicrobiales bacterium]
MEIPRIISVDDHVVEPPDLWSSRLPQKYRDRGPRVVREKAKFGFKGGVFSFERGAPDGDWCDIWLYDDLVYPFPKLSAAVGFENLDNEPVTFDQIRPGSWKQKERLEDMAANHVDASLCFPNVLPRFCGQAFLERQDKELALLCVQIYNDWMIDEWCAGDGRGKLIPLTIVPLWDPQLAAEEVRRCAAKGSHAVTFSENPVPLGLPSVHSPDRFWDPFFAACEETDTVINMHIGSSSKMPATSPDAPFIVSSTLTFQNAMGSMLDYIFSGTFQRFPNLRIAYSEGQVGWAPYVLERADKLWEERGNASFGSDLPEPPSSYVKDHIWFCIFDDETGLRNRDVIGIDQITFEVDYPHADSTFPHTRETATKIVQKAGLSDDEVYKFLRGNAIKAYRLDQYFGITE